MNEPPSIIFRSGENTPVEAIARYLVKPCEAGRVKTRPIKTMPERLNAEPEQVMIPRADAR